jgi:hypothetical protein
VSGLTENQKQLIQQKWFELDRPGIFEFGSKVFQTVFNRDRRFLRAVGLSHLADRKPSTWPSQLNFRVHVRVRQVFMVLKLTVDFSAFLRVH